MRIGYTDDPVHDYNRALDTCMTLRELQMTVGQFKRIASDAVESVATMTEADMLAFRAGLKKERRGKFAGEEWSARFGAIVMPELALHVGMVAAHFRVPWGLAFIRCKDMGRITEDSGIAKWKGEQHDP